MALVIADRVKETTTTTSTGVYTLNGAKLGFQSFAAVGNGNTTYYVCTDGVDFEVGIGTFTASGTTLSRDTILESSNSDNPVDWSAGSRDVFVTVPAEKYLVRDASGNVSLTGDLSFGDNDKAIFGAGSDLSIYHDSATGHSIITESGGGALQLRGENLILEHPTTGNNYLLGVDGASGYVKLYHNGVDKLTTTSTGIDITGGVTTDAYSYLNGLRISGADTGNTVYQQSGDLSISSASGAISLKPSGTNILHATNTGVGIGTTSTAGHSNHTNLFLGGTGNIYAEKAVTADASLHISQNAHVDTDGSWEYRVTDEATNYYQYAGTHVWRYAASGTAGNDISWSEAMRITSSGSVGIGTSSPSRQLHLSGSTPIIRLTDTDTNAYGEISSSSSDGNLMFYADQGNTQANTTIRFYVDTTERMRIDSNGYVGIGTSSPHLYYASQLVVDAPDESGITIVGDTTHQNYIMFADGTSGDTRYRGYIAYDHADDHLKIATIGTERMRIDSSGNLLVGKTSSNSNTVGIELTSSDLIRVARSGGATAYLNRKTNDGDIITFAKDGTTVGSIGTHASNITIGTGATGLRFYDTDNVIMPRNPSTGASVNGTISLGEPLNRFKDLYLSGGVYLGGTGAANKLEDYEEGSYQPTVYGATTAGSTALNGSYNTLHYTKIGRQVTIQGEIRLSGSPSGAGVLRITLPFTNMYTEGSEAVGSIQFWNANFDNNAAWVSVVIPRGGSYLRLKETVDNATSETSMDITDLGANAELTIGITYFVA